MDYTKNTVRNLLASKQIENEFFLDSIINREGICSIVISILEETDNRIIENINWDTRIDEKIKELNLDSDTDIDIDSALQKRFGITFSMPINPPTFGNVVNSIEFEIKKLNYPNKNKTGILAACNLLFVTLKIRNWIKETNHNFSKLSINLNHLNAKEKKYLINKIELSFGLNLPIVIFDKQTYRFLVKSWPTNIHKIKNLSLWVEQRVSERRNNLIKQFETINTI